MSSLASAPALSSQPVRAIRVEGLSKEYLLARRVGADDTFREMLIRSFTAPFSRLRSETPPVREPFVALRDISFDVAHGETLGIIGRNGAGKSTLLKILTGITDPTRGRVELRGRVASLLEVGTGFHPELTGRENVFLNGSVLGMSRKEIRRKFDEIVAFADVERFLDTPVKRYSSGMYLRLAFAVAAHLEPEILLVDEVLAVGDVAFQKQCLGRMGEIAKAGRTVVFVSHNLPAVSSMCSRALLLQAGSVIADGPPGDVINTYIAGLNPSGGVRHDLSESPRAAGRERAIREAWLENADAVAVHSVSMGSAVRFSFQFVSSAPILDPGFGFRIESTDGQCVFALNNYMLEAERSPPISSGTATCDIDSLPLLPGRYLASVSLVESRQENVDAVDGAFSFDVVPSDVYGNGVIPVRDQGFVFVRPASVAVVDGSGGSR